MAEPCICKSISLNQTEAYGSICLFRQYNHNACTSCAAREREKSHRLRHGAWQKPPCFGWGRVLRTPEAAPASLPSEFFPHRTLTTTAWPTSPLSFLSCLLCPHPGGTAMEVVFSHGHPPPQSAGRVWRRHNIGGLHAEGAEGDTGAELSSMIPRVLLLLRIGSLHCRTVEESWRRRSVPPRRRTSPVKMEMKSTAVFT